MKTIYLILLFIISYFFVSCATSKWESNIKSIGSVDVAIENCITDFLNTSKLIKSDSIFSVSLVENNQDILIVGIAVPSDIIRPSYKNKVGTYNDLFPTKFLIKENILFYWNDSTVAISQEILNTLERYNHIDFSRTELQYEMITGVHDDGVKGMVYYICKDDYKNYKKTGISNIVKHYKTPSIKCIGK